MFARILIFLLLQGNEKTEHVILDCVLCFIITMEIVIKINPDFHRDKKIITIKMDYSNMIASTLKFNEYLEIVFTSAKSFFLRNFF